MKNNFLTLRILQIIAIAMLLGALASNPYSYYQILRWFISFVAGYSAYVSYKQNDNVWLWIMIVIAVLFNPIAPIYLTRDIWFWINIIVSGIMFTSIFKEKIVFKKG